MSQLHPDEYEIFFYSAVPFRPLHEGIGNLNLAAWYVTGLKGAAQIHLGGIFWFYRVVIKVIGQSLAKKLIRGSALKYLHNCGLRKLIKQVKPTVLHSMETQKAGYLVSGAVGNGKKFKWIHSTWGVDLHYYLQFPEHRAQIKKLLSQVDLLVVEGDRDSAMAAENGYRGMIEIIPSVGGSLDFELINKTNRDPGPVSRKLILLKGYQGEERLAINALKALRKIKGLLAGFEVIIYSCNNQLLPMVEEIINQGEFSVRVASEFSYTEFLAMVASARISITNNLSDGVPNTMLEAMALGAFPIQSNTAITQGWIEDGVNGLLTDPTNIDQIASAISRALKDDKLVSEAAIINRSLVEEKLNSDAIDPIIRRLYRPD
jgi:hypothetical protein